MHFGRTQITPPSIPPGLVARPALLEALDRGDDRALTLVCAPPGYGKSLLLAHWVRERADTPTAWVNLEPDDNDPRRLWGAVLTALRACPGVPADSRLHRLVVSRASVELEFLADLVEALDALPVRIRLVLDDAHSLVSPESLRGLQLVMRSPRPQLRLVLAPGATPACPSRGCDWRNNSVSFGRSSCSSRPRSRRCCSNDREFGWLPGTGQSSRNLSMTELSPASPYRATMPPAPHPCPARNRDRVARRAGRPAAGRPSHPTRSLRA
jgi:hypothetical protein